MTRKSSGRGFVSSQNKILLVANTGWYLYNFRLPLARRLRQEGFEVVLVAPDDSYVPRLQAEGFRVVLLSRLSRRGMNPFFEIIALMELMKIYFREKPRAVHHFTIKCVLYGTMAAKLTGVRSVVNAVTGLGHIFLGKRAVTRAVRPFVRWLYRKILRARRGHVVFQNPDDLETFIEAGLVVPEKTVIIRSSGVCLQKFAPRPGKPNAPASEVPTVLFVGRLIKEKGVHDFVEAARIVKSHRAVCFQMAGAPDPGNPSSIPEEELEKWRLEGAVDLLGHVESIADLMSLADLVVLPSYREGTPRTLLEAAALSKPIVATDVPGCREIVRDNFNGKLVPREDPVALAQAIEAILDDKALSAQMGMNGRSLVAQEFSVESVVQETMKVYQRLGIA